MADTTTQQPPVTERERRLRRCMRACCTVALNLAYHRARRLRGVEVQPDEGFWDAAEGNFLDAAVLAWCALFADDNLKGKKPRLAKHGWRKIVPADEREAFERGLHEAVGLSPEGFAELIEVFKCYRDKWVAHLDSETKAVIPHMQKALQGAAYYYAYVLAQLDFREHSDTYPDLGVPYDWALENGKKAWAG